MLKPREPSDGTLADPLAPLIAIELAPGAEELDRRKWLGTLALDRDGQSAVSTAPAVYGSSTRVNIGGRNLEVLTYTWWFRTGQHVQAGENVSGTEGLTSRGIRLVLGEDGFPAVCEVSGAKIADPRARRVLYVSQSLETRAAAAFGPPLPGRRFSIERAHADASGVVVAGVLEDGPVPSGPFVYLDADGWKIAAVRCRCSPALMDEVPATDYYDLKPAAAAGAIETGREGPREALSRSLEQALRWPP